jgi:competence protein ComEA
MDGDSVRERINAAARWLDASPAEVAGLAIMLAGAVAVAGMLWWTARPAPHPDAGAVPAPHGVGEAHGPVPVGADTVTVHVSGAVAAPGLVVLSHGARVADAVSAAGGPRIDADLDQVNLARPLNDGERLEVPILGAAPAGGGGGAAPAGTGATGDGRLDLNRATAGELETLPGIGPVLAERIVRHREANGPFTDIGQLRDVAGIGEKVFQGLADLVAV